MPGSNTTYVAVYGAPAMYTPEITYLEDAAKHITASLDALAPILPKDVYYRPEQPSLRADPRFDEATAALILARQRLATLAADYLSGLIPPVQTPEAEEQRLVVPADEANT